MNILIIQENGRHEKNRNFRECFSLKRCFEKLNHTCTVWGLGHENYESLPNFESFDIILNIENYDQTGWVPDLSNVKTKKYLWSIDAHVKGVEPYKAEFYRGNYNKILQSTLQFVDNDSIWFPNAFDNDLIKPLGIEKVYDVGFCGNVQNRGNLLDIISTKFNLKRDIFVIGQDMVNAVNSYKIHFNCNIGIDVNYRSFETLGCKTALITNYNEAYEKLGFENNKNCIMYKTIDELLQGIENILSNSKLRYDLENEGFELSSKHTYFERVKYFLQII